MKKLRKLLFNFRKREKWILNSIYTYEGKPFKTEIESFCTQKDAQDGMQKVTNVFYRNTMWSAKYMYENNAKVVVDGRWLFCFIEKKKL